jgi:hypothetical protein
VVTVLLNTLAVTDLEISADDPSDLTRQRTNIGILQHTHRGSRLA